LTQSYRDERYKLDVCMKHQHPRLDDYGKPVLLREPNQPSVLSCWSDPGKVASVVPNGQLPALLSNIEFTAWTEAPSQRDGWEQLARQSAACFTEPSMPSAPGKSAASGVVVLEGDGRVWVVSPSNAFGGYANTFPKGKLDPGMSLRANALKEAFEESGLQVALTGFLCDAVRSTSLTRYYTARRLGGHPGTMGWETQAVHLVPRSQLAAFVDHPNDRPVLQALLALKVLDHPLP
jgi:ADP-ribose pyrophosphatase YjhB (NUDIX family)